MILSDYYRNWRVWEELESEIEDWNLLGYHVKFVKGVNSIDCILLSSIYLDRDPIHGSAEIEEGLDENRLKLLAILDAGYGEDADSQIKNRGLRYLFCKGM